MAHNLHTSLTLLYIKYTQHVSSSNASFSSFFLFLFFFLSVSSPSLPLSLSLSQSSMMSIHQAVSARPPCVAVPQVAPEVLMDVQPELLPLLVSAEHRIAV